MANRKKHAHVTSRTLARQGMEARSAIERHRDEPAIASFRERLGPIAEQYEVKRARVVGLKIERSAALMERDRAIEELARRTAQSVALLGSVVPDFDRAGLKSDTVVPLDRLANAERVIGLLQEQGDRVPGGAVMVERLRPAVERASMAIERAQAARVALQQLQDEVRVLSLELQTELKGFRRVLRTTLGKHHIDYQRMRNRTRRNDAEPPEPPEPPDEVESEPTSGT